MTKPYDMSIHPQSSQHQAMTFARKGMKGGKESQRRRYLGGNPAAAQSAFITRDAYGWNAVLCFTEKAVADMNREIGSPKNFQITIEIKK